MREINQEQINIRLERKIQTAPDAIYHVRPEASQILRSGGLVSVAQAVSAVSGL